MINLGDHSSLLAGIINNPWLKYCKHPEHNPPTELFLIQGDKKVVCPECGKIQVINIKTDQQ